MNDTLGFYNHILYFSTMDIAVRCHELLSSDTELFLLFNMNVEVLGHEATDDGDGPSLQVQTSTAIDQELQAHINQTLAPHHASYNVPMHSSFEQYQEWRSGELPSEEERIESRRVHWEERKLIESNEPLDYGNEPYGYEEEYCDDHAYAIGMMERVLDEF